MLKFVKTNSSKEPSAKSKMARIFTGQRLHNVKIPIK